MKKPNKRVQANRQRIAEKKAKRKRARKQIRTENISRRQNIIETKKQELFKKWVSAGWKAI